MGDGDGAGLERGVVGVGAALGVGDGVGAAQPAIKIPRRAITSIFIVNWTVRVPDPLRKSSIAAPCM
jgi:hypothetical protein